MIKSLLTCSIFYCLIYFSWRIITLQYCSGFCHTWTWISHGCTCVPHPEPPSHLPPHPIPLGHPSAPALSTLSHIKSGLETCFIYDNKNPCSYVLNWQEPSHFEPWQSGSNAYTFNHHLLMTHHIWLTLVIFLRRDWGSYYGLLI